MLNKQIGKQTDSGVSPVIGVILMVAVTVALVALVTVTVFDLGGDVSESPDATVQLEQNEGNIDATLLRNENVDYIYLSAGSNTWGDESKSGVSDGMSTAGDTLSTSNNNDGGSSVTLSDGDTINAVAVMPDGSEEVLTSTTYNA